jgi:uncharacterized protein YbjT (DUF2867 family)
MAEKRVALVTGATGASGSAVIREFARNHVAVRALVRSGRKAEELARLPGVEIVIGDMLRPDSLGAALDGVDRALMISSSEAAMLETQCRFVDAAKRVGVRHIVKFSGKESSVAFDPMRPYADALFAATRPHRSVGSHGLPDRHRRGAAAFRRRRFECVS